MPSAAEKVRARKPAKPRLIKIGGVVVELQSHPSKGTISRERLKEAVAAVVALRKA
jgi:hypothetical protein